MRITIRQAAALPATVSALARHRFAFALGRFGLRVQSLSVRLRDLNGPRGGEDKLCTVAVQLHGSPREIVVRETDTDAAAAISRAADRTARAVARAIDAASDWRPRSRRRER
jgi:putative sigma-54 modulation protein